MVTSQTIKESLQEFYATHNFGDDGGYSSRFAKVKIGWIPVYIPNTAGRKRALFFHDVHHLVMEFKTNLKGEAQIGAWEVGSGCRDFLAAWVLNLLGMVMGLFICPGKTYRAFCLGRRSKNFYHGLATVEEIGRMTVPEARKLISPDANEITPDIRDALTFVWWSLVAVAIGLIPIAALAAVAAWIYVSVT